jgi:4-amino-4-deoxy-L-arabinose transferase-like glycosyltransferase
MIDWAAVAVAALGVIVLAAALARFSLAYTGGSTARAATTPAVGARRLDWRRLVGEPGEAVREEALPLLVLLGPLFLLAGAWTVLGVALVAGLWAARRATTGAFLPRTPLDWPIALMMAMLPVSLIVSFDIGFSLGRAALLLYGVALFYAFVDWVQSRAGRLRAGVYLYLAAGGALAVLGLLGTDWQDKAPVLGDLVRYLPQVAGGLSRDQTGFHPNIVAGALLWVLAPLVALLASRGAVQGRARWALTALLVLTGGTLLLAQSRGALVGLVAGLALLAWLAWPRLRVAMVGVLAVAAVVLVAAGPALVTERLLDTAGTTLGPLANTGNLAVRADAWQSALRAISDKPLTGIGMDTFRRLIRTEYRAPSIPDTYDIGHAHNQFLQAGLDLGLPGLVGYLALWIVAAALAVRSYRAAPDPWTHALAAGIGAALLATFAHGLTDSVALVSKPGVFFWGILALDVGLWGAVRSHERTGASLSASAARWVRGVAVPAFVGALPVLLPTATALALRLYGYGRLSLWLEEAVTLRAARLPWTDVLGLSGAYDTTPPLYYALSKLATIALPETDAARMVSVLAGTLTVAVVCVLVGRLAGRGAGVVAGLALAAAPVHIWYSQDARPYALAGLMVALSYLALAAYRQEGRPSWAVAYGVSAAAALYTDNGAIYALVPQVLLLAWMWREQGRRALPLVNGAIAGFAAYLPWLLWRMPDIAAVLETQTGYGLTLAGLGEQAVRAAGLGGAGTYIGADPTPWYNVEAIRVPVAAAVAIIAVLGVVALAKRSWFALAVTGALTAGTGALALAVDLFAPAYPGRVTLYLLMGWVALLGAAAAGGLPRRVRSAGVVAGVAVLLVSSGTLAAVYGQAEKQHWRELAARADEVRKYGIPVLAYPDDGPVGTLLSLYQPGVLSHEEAREKGAVWVAHAQGMGDEALAQEMAGRGYVRVMTVAEPPNLSLDLYVGDNMSVGAEAPFNGRFEGPERGAFGWDASGPEARLEPDEATGRRVVLTNDGEREVIYASATGGGDGLYVVWLEARARMQEGSGRLFVECINAQGEWIATGPNSEGQAVEDTGGQWKDVGAAVICPAGTERVRIDLRNAGRGEVAYRGVRLWWVGR